MHVTKKHTTTHIVRTVQGVPGLHTSERQDPSVSAAIHTSWPPICCYREHGPNIMSHQYKYEQGDWRRDAQKPVYTHIHLRRLVWVAVGEGQPADIKANSLYYSHRSDEVILSHKHTEKETFEMTSLWELEEVDVSNFLKLIRGHFITAVPHVVRPQQTGPLSSRTLIQTPF